MRWFLLPLCAATSACFTPTNELNVDTDGTGSTSAGTESTSGTASGSTTNPSTTDTGPTTTASTDPSTGPTTGPTSSTTDTATGSSGETELGPQLVMTVPADGDVQAPLDTYFLLYFDRVISLADATGHILVGQDGGALAPVSPQPCPPDNDPTCIGAVFPASFYDPDTGRLPGNTSHQVVVEADFPDPNGLTNTMDQMVEFTTFDFEANVYDDTAFFGFEFGGIVYDPANENLFIAGVADDNSNCFVRRIPAPGGVLGTATTVASPIYTGGGPYCYGLDLYEDTLFLSMTYAADVRSYTNLAAGSLDATEVLFGPTTPLPSPDDELGNVWSVARHAGRTFFARGSYFSTGRAIVELSAAGGWQVFQTGQNLWSDNDDVQIATGVVDGTSVLFAHASDNLYKFRLSDGVLLDQLDDAGSSYASHLMVDASDRLYLGLDSGLIVYDATDYTILATRPGIAFSRFALVEEDSDTSTLYFNRFRDDPIIGRLTVDF